MKIPYIKNCSIDCHMTKKNEKYIHIFVSFMMFLKPLITVVVLSIFVFLIIWLKQHRNIQYLQLPALTTEKFIGKFFEFGTYF